MQTTVNNLQSQYKQFIELKNKITIKYHFTTIN